VDAHETKRKEQLCLGKRPSLGKRLARLWSRCGATVLLVGGAAALTVGVGLVFVPAGWIAGGAVAIAGGILAAIGGGDDK
jgi:hypothetical protein